LISPRIPAGASHGRGAIFQVAQAALPHRVFIGIESLTNGLRGPASTAVSA
jgi:hypothetical protein